MPGLEDPRGRLELERDRHRLPGHERCRRERRLAVAEVEEAAGHELRGAVGEDVAELGREEGDRRIRRHGHGEPGVAGDHELVLAGGPVVDERQPLVGALVGRLAPGEMAGARDPRGRADVAADRERRRCRCASAPGPARPRRPAATRRRRATRPGAREIGRRRRRPPQEDADGCGRLRRRAVAQPLVEEADHLGNEVDVRARQRARRAHVAPRPDEQLARGPGSRSKVRKLLLR